MSYDYDPEAHLRQLGIEPEYRHLPPEFVGFTIWGGPDGTRVEIDPRGYVREIRSTMAHEAVHVERGPSPKWATAAEERRVNGIAARRLIAANDLIDAARWSDSLEEIAEQLNTDQQMVRDRLRDLTPEEGRRFDRAIGHSGVQTLGRSTRPLPRVSRRRAARLAAELAAEVGQ